MCSNDLVSVKGNGEITNYGARSIGLKQRISIEVNSISLQNRNIDDLTTKVD